MNYFDPYLTGYRKDEVNKDNPQNLQIPRLLPEIAASDFIRYNI